MLYLPIPCPECHELTMEVIAMDAVAGYEAKCTSCGCLCSGTIKVESMIANGDNGNNTEGARRPRFRPNNAPTKRR